MIESSHHDRHTPNTGRINLMMIYIDFDDLVISTTHTVKKKTKTASCMILLLIVSHPHTLSATAFTAAPSWTGKKHPIAVNDWHASRYSLANPANLRTSHTTLVSNEGSPLLCAPKETNICLEKRKSKEPNRNSENVLCESGIPRSILMAHHCSHESTNLG